MVLASRQGRDVDGQRSGKEGNRKADRRMSAEARERSKALRKQASQAEAELNRLWKRRAEIDQMLSAPQSNGGPSVGELMKTRAEIERHLATAEHRWLEASEAAERARVESAARIMARISGRCFTPAPGPSEAVANRRPTLRN
jgi:septal ring factor EnvC (AmiA/AmiB activator)